MGPVGIKAGHMLRKLPRVQPPLMGRQGNDFVTGVLYGPGLMDVYMPGFHRDHRLISFQHGRNDHSVCLGAAGKKVYLGLPAQGAADFFLCATAEFVLPVARLGRGVQQRQPFQDFGMGAVGIVA